MTLSSKQRGEIVRLYYLNAQNTVKALRAYRSKHKLKRGPCTKQSIINLIKKFEETGCTCDKLRCGRPAVPVEIAAEVHEAITDQVQDQVQTARGVSRKLNLPYSTIRKILTSVLHMFPYKYQRVQMLQLTDFQLRLNFANEYLIRYDEDDSFPLQILWTDEAHFTLSGSVNSKNCVHWAEKNPHEIFASPLHEAKVTVWCGITGSFVIGPYFFEEVTPKGLKTCSITSQRYETMLNNYLIPQLQQRKAIGNIVWMQDGAPPHVSNSVKQLLQQTFGDKVISRHFQFAWPPRSPDLTPMDFWLWGYLKSKVYIGAPKTLPDLKDSIVREFQQIPLVMVKSAIISTVCRMQNVIVCEGGHVENF